MTDKFEFGLEHIEGGEAALSRDLDKLVLLTQNDLALNLIVASLHGFLKPHLPKTELSEEEQEELAEQALGRVDFEGLLKMEEMGNSCLNRVIRYFRQVTKIVQSPHCARLAPVLVYSTTMEMCVTRELKLNKLGDK